MNTSKHQPLPSVTVVTVCFNSIDLLRHTMESVEHLSYPNLEYIIIDGNSSDGTRDYLASYSGKLDRWISEPDKGIYDAMNKAARMAKGEWIIFMNAGDIFASSDCIEQAFKSIDPTAKVVYGDVKKLGKDGKLHVKEAEECHNSHRMIFCHQSAFTRTQELVDHPFDISLRLSADFDFFKGILRRGGEMQKVNVPIAIFDTQGVSNRRRSAGLKENIKIVIRHDKFKEKARLLPHLIFPYIMCKLRGK